MLLKHVHADPDVALEMTPMIDIVFNLMIFFLVATTFHQTERELNIALPVASAAGPVTATLREIVINVDAEGTIVVSGRTMEAEDLQRMIEEAVNANPTQKVTVRGDRTVAYGAIVAVLDICKASGIQEPYLDTVLE